MVKVLDDLSRIKGSAHVSVLGQVNQDFAVGLKHSEGNTIRRERQGLTHFKTTPGIVDRFTKCRPSRSLELSVNAVNIIHVNIDVKYTSNVPGALGRPHHSATGAMEFDQSEMTSGVIFGCQETLFDARTLWRNVPRGVLPGWRIR